MGLGNNCDCDSTLDQHLPQPLTARPRPCRCSGCNPSTGPLTLLPRSARPCGSLCLRTITTANSSSVLGPAVVVAAVVPKTTNKKTELASPPATGPHPHLHLRRRVRPCTSISSSPLQNSALLRGRRRRRPLLSPASLRRVNHGRSSTESASASEPEPEPESLQASRHRRISVEAVSTAASPAQRLPTLPRDPTDQLNSPP